VQDHQSLDAEMMLTAQRTWHFVKVVRWREGALSSAGMPPTPGILLRRGK
jgi:hypothetical protein